MRATYSPDDNKLRLYSESRLDADDYARVRAAGFRWAPQQKLFVAPMWTPDRADLLVDLCGDIEDDDTSLTDRAEERADRFTDYQQSRAEDATAAHDAAKRIADGIPFGQPILVGHHSEKRARKDAERIDKGFRRAVKMWETSQYWKSRAAGAIAHAKYKERPDVRHRRIKTIEADKRRQTKIVSQSEALTEMWSKPLETPLKDGTVSPRRRALAIAQIDHGYWSQAHPYRRRDADGRETGDVYHTGPMSLWEAVGGNIDGHDPDIRAIATPEAIRDRALAAHEARIAWATRWITHYDLRLDYERAMLAESGGLITDKTEYPIAVGGRVLVRGSWVTVLRVNRKDGAICSVTTNDRYVSVKGIEEIKDYQPPTTDEIQAVASKLKLPPLLNLKTDDAEPMTQAEYTRIYKDSKGSSVIKATDTTAAYRRRYVWRRGARRPVFLTDSKVHTVPDIETTINEPDAPAVTPPTPTIQDRPAYTPPARTELDDVRDALRKGPIVQVVTAPNLFPTPLAVARQMAHLAALEPGLCVLEPSAGTGNLVTAVLEQVDTEVLAYEINSALCSELARRFPSYKLKVVCRDFLTVTDYQGQYPRILLNPPFDHGSDIKHVQHALTFLAPGGTCVALVCDGPRQREILKPTADAWIPLPDDTFADQGTNVRTALAVFSK
jgi:protein-L-isoaspartate O-methyltransferase